MKKPEEYETINTWDFIFPCEHRDSTSKQPGAPQNLCMLASEKIGYLHGVDPLGCAKCQINGVFNPVVVDAIALSALKKHLSVAYFGFHTAEDSVVALFKRIWPLAVAAKDTKHVTDMLMGCVAKGRLSPASAKRLLEETFDLPPEATPLFEQAVKEASERTTTQRQPAAAPKPCCGGAAATEAKTTFDKLVNAGKSVLQAAEAFAGLSLVANPLIKAARLEVCHGCQATDQEGVRLYRLVDNSPVCGKLFTENILRDPSKDGCGCYLDEKTGVSDAHCPLGKW